MPVWLFDWRPQYYKSLLHDSCNLEQLKATHAMFICNPWKKETNATIKQTTQWKVLENLTTYVVYVGFEECFSNVLMLFFKSVGTTSTKDEVAGGIFAFNLTNGYFAKTHELLKSLQITEVLLSKHLLKIWSKYITFDIWKIQSFSDIFEVILDFES